MCIKEIGKECKYFWGIYLLFTPGKVYWRNFLERVKVKRTLKMDKLTLKGKATWKPRAFPKNIIELRIDGSENRQVNEKDPCATQ